MNNNNKPLVSIITPSFNQGEFIEETLLSVKNQDYPNIEHIVVDGGSTDNTVDILKKYEKEYNLRWVSEPDDGQSDAINKGINMADGDVIGWLNSDDVYFLGYVDYPFKFYDEIDVALVCSKNEGMGRVTVEAMVAGKLVIGLDNAGTSELIDDGKTGLLYDGSIESLVQKMEYALINDLTDMVINANAEALEKFTIEKYSQEVKRIIFKTL